MSKKTTIIVLSAVAVVCLLIGVLIGSARSSPASTRSEEPSPTPTVSEEHTSTPAAAEEPLLDVWRKHSGGFYYSLLDDGTAQITGVDKDERDYLVIPSTIDGYTVTHVYWFFTSDDLDPEGNFDPIEIKTIKIPNSVTSINEYWLDYVGTTDFIVPFDHPVFCDIYGVLYNKPEKRLVRYPVGRTASTFEIPQGVEQIAAYAFVNSDTLTSVTIPESVTTIGEDAFANCGSLTEVTIPESVTTIGEGAFADCDGLTEVTIPQSVTLIGDYAFYGCKNLKKVVILGSETDTREDIFTDLTVIAEGAFSECSSLEDVTIPPSVTRIARDAFPSEQNITFHYTEGSYAEQYLKQIGVIE